tara:strand:- start:2780 stop:3094 length:315 start_codon:yes stop_codon:yes gene_type:complete
MKIETIYTNEMPRWRYIKRYTDDDGNEKVIKKFFKNLYDLSEYIDEPVSNIQKFTCDHQGYKTKMKYRTTMKRWEGVEITKMKFKKFITYVLDEGQNEDENKDY